MRRLILFAIIFAIFPRSAFSEQAHKLGKIVVTPSRLMTDLSRNASSVEVLDDSIFDLTCYYAIPDAIGSVGGIDVRRRGPEGVQADINIRGSTFEENLVLIDGIRINDPQTGHYNMDLPLSMADVEKVEILKGPASSVYGANSFGGVINIITRKPEGSEIKIYADGGSYDFVNGAVSVTHPIYFINNRFSFDQSRSSGYMPETEFGILSLSDKLAVETPVGTYDFLFGFTKKDYGADSFYSSSFSNEEEHTDTRFFKLDGIIEDKNLMIQPKLFLKRHWDKFILDRNRPGWQTNYHTTYSYGGQIDCILEHPFMDVAYGYELSADTIDSTNLQTHSLTRDGIYIELRSKTGDDLSINLGAREDYFSNFGWQFSPSVKAAYLPSKDVTLRGSIGRAYRIPTFNDLYYNDAANTGNADLQPESAWSYEAGVDCRTGLLDTSVTVFLRDSYDTIDWIRYSAADRWRSSNIGSVRTVGLELSLELLPRRTWTSSPVEAAFLKYTALDSYAKHDYLSKYALDYLKQHIATGIEFEIGGFKNSWVLNFKKRVGDSGYLTTDTKISKEIVRKSRLSAEAFLDISNLFDIDYSEQSDVRMPGRWIKCGSRVKF